VDDTVPFSVVLKAGGPALLLMVAPTVGAIWYGLLARREGELRPGRGRCRRRGRGDRSNVGSYLLGLLG